MFEVLIISIGLVLVIEGILYFMLADKLHDLALILKNFNKQKVKIISLSIVLLGLCLIYFTFRFYNYIK